MKEKGVDRNTMQRQNWRREGKKEDEKRRNERSK